MHIPGDAANYPSLDVAHTPRNEYGIPECHAIYFHFGGEVAKPHYLSYKKAFIQYNFGYYDGSTYKTDGDPYSATPLLRNRWYALAAPLKKIASGDFSLGGYPFTYQMLFSSTTGTSGESSELQGSWTLNDMTNGYEPGKASNYAISLLVDPYENGVLGKDDHSNLNTLKGIIEIPYFENQPVSNLHRIHEYNPTDGYSIFKYFYHQEEGFPFSRSTAPDTLYRAEEAYRFVFEDENNNPVDPFVVSVAEDREVMVGNPFVSSLDFDGLYEANLSSMESTCKLYVNHQFLSYDYYIGINPLFDKYIAPLQAFFITTKSTGDGSEVELLFPPEEVSVVRPANNPLQLKSTGSKNNYQQDVLFLIAGNEEGESLATLALNKEGGKNSRKMFISYEENQLVPQLYIQHKEDPEKNDILYVAGEEAILSLGIKCTTESQMTLQIVNTETLSTAHLILYDRKLNREVDFYADNTYSFTHDPEMEGRFELRIKDIGSLSSLEPNNRESTEKQTKVFYTNHTLYVHSRIPFEKITIYSPEGKKIHIRDVYPHVQSAISLSPASGIYICEVVLPGYSPERHKFIVR